MCFLPFCVQHAIMGFGVVEMVELCAAKTTCHDLLLFYQGLKPDQESSHAGHSTGLDTKETIEVMEVEYPAYLCVEKRDLLSVTVQDDSDQKDAKDHKHGKGHNWKKSFGVGVLLDMSMDHDMSASEVL